MQDVLDAYDADPPGITIGGLSPHAEACLPLTYDPKFIVTQDPIDTVYLNQFGDELLAIYFYLCGFEGDCPCPNADDLKAGNYSDIVAWRNRFVERVKTNRRFPTWQSTMVMCMNAVLVHFQLQKIAHEYEYDLILLKRDPIRTLEN